MRIAAIILAAGTGSRFGGVQPKQYLPLAGKPMLWHSVRALCVVRPENVFIVLAPDDEEFARHDWSAFEGRVEPLYCGGETRRDSVYNGLVAASAAADTDDFILVHDAARPCLGSEELERLLGELEDDPLSFAVRDRATWVLALVGMVITVAATGAVE